MPRDNLHRPATCKSVAIHEAGHLFAGLAIPCPRGTDTSREFKCVWIRKDRGGHWEGKVETRWELPMPPEEARRRALVLLAGPIAEIRWRTRSRWEAQVGDEEAYEIAAGTFGGTNNDFERVAEILGGVGDRDHYTAFQDAWRNAEMVVHKNWKHIRAFADRLLAQNCIYDVHMGEVQFVAVGSGVSRLP
jgi:hypothetical protein